MSRDRRNDDGVVMKGTDDDGRGKDFVVDNLRDHEIDFFVGDCSDGTRLCLFVGLWIDFDCDFVGDIGGHHDLGIGLAVVTDFVSVSGVAGGIVPWNGIGLVVVIEVQGFVDDILCLRLIFVGLG